MYGVVSSCHKTTKRNQKERKKERKKEKKFIEKEEVSLQI